MLESDEVLMLAVRDGDPAKLGVLFSRHHTGLFNFFARMMGNRNAAEDLVQEVFLRVLKSRQTYRDGASFRAWIFQIARNARADYFKKHHPEFPVATDLVDDESCAADACHSFEKQHEIALLKRALLLLPDEKRELLVLARWQEMKHHDIAQLLGCSVQAVDVRLHRALKELRQIYLRIAGEKKHAV